MSEKQLVSKSQSCDYLAMDQKAVIAEIERRAKDAGLPLIELCRRADINRSTFFRWKNGQTSPTLKDLLAVSLALEGDEG